MKMDREQPSPQFKMPFGILLFILASFTYFGVLSTLFIFNTEMYLNNTESGEEIISELTFHLLEFSTAFAYTAIVLMTTAQYTFDFSEINRKFWSLNTLGIFCSCLEVGTTATALVLIAITHFKYEVACHYLEYCTLLLLSILDFSIIFSRPYSTRDYKFWLNVGLAIVCILGACTCIILFTIDAEAQAHFVEFSIDALLTINTALVVVSSCDFYAQPEEKPWKYYTLQPNQAISQPINHDSIYMND